MRPRWLFGMVAVVLLAVPAGLQAQRAGAGGGVHAAGGPGGRPFTGNVSHSGGIRTIPTVAIANGSSVARPRSNPFTVYGMAAPSRFGGAVGSPTLGMRAPHAGAFPNGNGANHKHHPRNPRGAAPQFYFLTGGYYYADPGVLDDSEGQTQDATDQRDVVADQQDEGQQADDQQPPPDDQQRDVRADAGNAPAPAPEQEQQTAPLPDVGSFTLVMRDGTQVDALAFTRAQDKIIYITPDGGRRTVAVSDIDSDSTARVNEERGTPLQSPL